MNSESGDHTGGGSSQTHQQPGTTSFCLDTESSLAVDGNENRDTAGAVGNGSNEDRDSADVDARGNVGDENKETADPGRVVGDVSKDTVDIQDHEGKKKTDTAGGQTLPAAYRDKKQKNNSGGIATHIPECEDELDPHMFSQTTTGKLQINQSSFSFASKNKPESNPPTFSFAPTGKPDSNQPTFSFAPTSKPESNPPTFSFAPTGKPDSNQPMFSFAPTSKPESNPPMFSFAPTGKQGSNQPTFSFAPTGKPESNPLTFSFAPTSKPETNPHTVCFAPTGNQESDPPNFSFVPTSKPESNPPNFLVTLAGKLSTSTCSIESAGKQESSFNLQSGLDSIPNPFSFCSNAEFPSLAERLLPLRATKKCQTLSSPSGSAKQDGDGVSLCQPDPNIIQKTTSIAQQDGGRDTGVRANSSGLLTQVNVGRPATSLQADVLPRPGDQTCATVVIRPSSSQESENSFAQIPSSSFFFSHPPPTMAGETRSLQELLLSAAARLQERENENGKKSEAERARKDQKIQELERQLSELQSKHGEDHLEWERKLKKKDDFMKNQQAAIQEIKNDLQRCRNEHQSMKTTLSEVLESEKAAQVERDNVLRLKEQDDNKILQLQNEIKMHTDSFKELLKTNLNLRAKSLIWKAVARISSRISGQLQESSKRATEELEEKRSMNEMLQSVLKDALDNAAAKEAALLMSREDFHRQNATLQQQLEDSVASCAEFKQAASSLQTECELSQSEVQQLSEECRRLEEEKQSFAAASHDWEQQATFYKQVAEEKQLHIQVLEGQKEAATVQMKETGKNHVTLQLQLRQAEVTVNELRKEIETKNQRLRESEAHMEELTSQKLSQELELQVARITITSLENNATVAETEIQKLRETLATKQEEIETGSRAFIDIATQNTHLQAELEMKDREIMRYRLEADRARNDAWVASHQRAWSDDERRNQTY